MKEWIGEARTADDAIAQGLKKLGLSLDQVDVKVLGERASGLLSLFGFRRVKVRLTEKVRRFERDDRDREDYDRSSHSLEYRRSPKGRREERKPDERPARGVDRNQKDRPEERRRGARDPHRFLPPENKPEKNHDRNIQPPPGGDRRPFPKPKRAPAAPAASSEAKQVPAMPFHPPVPPEVLLAQWKDLLGWDDLSWTFQPVENHRLTVELKTSSGDRLGRNGGRSLDAFEYLFNLVSSGGDREKPWVSFRLAGVPSAEESRVVDKALFAAFQVRRTAKDFHLDPMSPGQRRAVHQTLANHPDVDTFSEGEGPARHVVVKLKEKK